MANEKHLALLKQGVSAWNDWRSRRPSESPDLAGANLRKADLSGANLWGADLEGAKLSEASLRDAHLGGANLSGANLRGADLMMARVNWANLWHARLNHAYLHRAALVGSNLSGADLSGADLSFAYLNEAKLARAKLVGANLFRADLSGADLAKADLSKANLSLASLVETNFSGAELYGARVYGVSVWAVTLDGARQSGLMITHEREPDVIVDSLEVAQFIYLILNNKNIRAVIDTITSKVVLILGRFTDERKAVLDALRTALRTRGYSPVLFDFEKPASRDLTETISTLAGMARFVIADITDAKSIPQELKTIVPNYPSVPVQPVILASQREYAMFEHYGRFPWVLPLVQYQTPQQLLDNLEAWVITPAEAKVVEQRPKPLAGDP